jgi:hypothetical protein
MSDFQENSIRMAHQNKKLEAIFIHQPIADAKQVKGYENFVEQMRGALQKSLESSDLFEEENTKPAKIDSAVKEIDPTEHAELYNSILPLVK